MKKLCLSLLVFLCAVTISLMCYAEDILTVDEIAELRCGIAFGDSREEILQKETLSEVKTKDTDRIYTEAARIEGIKGTSVCYHLDDNDLLVEVSYAFEGNGTDSHSRTKTYFDKIEKNLSKIYGAALDLQNGEHYRIVGEAIITADNAATGLTFFGYTSGIEQYTERVISFNSHYVKIDHSLHWTEWSNGNTMYYHHLSFKKFDDNTPSNRDEIESVVQPTATPAPAINIPFKISRAYIEKSSIGTPELYVVFTNTGTISIDRIDFTVKCYDVYGDQIKSYGFYDAAVCYYDEIIRKGQSSIDGYCWPLYGFDGTRSVKIAITKYHLTNGRTVEIPENQWVWRRFGEY